jgi:hypothetical protein
VRRTLILAGLSTLILNLASFGTGTTLPRPDTSRAALVSLGREYHDLRLWTEAIAEATDTLDASHSELARALAHQLARVIDPLEASLEKTTAALSTSQLEQVLPLWERMVFAHAGFLLLQEEAASLAGDPALEPSSLHAVALQLAAVLDFAAEIRLMIIQELTAPLPTMVRLL